MMDSIPMGRGAKPDKAPLFNTGYQLCLDIYRVSDKISDKGPIVDHLRSVALSVVYDLSKSGPKPSRVGIKRLKQALSSVHRLNMLMMFVHDLEYVNTEKYRRLSGDLNLFSSKLVKVIKYKERKLKNQ